jgi:hypothetical protein
LEELTVCTPVAVIPMSAHYDAMRTAVVIFMSMALLSGCAGKSTRAAVAAGCYRFDDGTPFFRIVGRTGIFIEKSNLKSFEIGSWRSGGSEVEVTPAFILHDGTGSAPVGPARMAEAVTTLSSGVIRYKQTDDQIILSIPIEAHGWEDVRLGKSC